MNDKKKNLLGKFVLVVSVVVAVLTLSSLGLIGNAAESSIKFRQVADLRVKLAAVFNTTTGHDHDGTNSKMVQYADGLTNSGRAVAVKTVIGTGKGGLGVYVTSTVFVTSEYQTVLSSGMRITLTSTPSISTTVTAAGIPYASGTMLTITSTDTVGAVIFQDNGTLSGSLLELNASSRTLNAYSTLRLIFDATDGKWREVSFSAN